MFAIKLYLIPIYNFKLIIIFILILYFLNKTSDKMEFPNYSEELNAFNKPKVYSLEEKYPLEKLNSRAFEILTYYVFNELKKEKLFFDSIELMQGVRERGRDAVLYKNEKTVGVIQCKHSQNISKKYTVQEIGTEIVKFILHYIQDEKLISDLNVFTYYFVTNTTVNEESKTFFLAPGNYAKNYPRFIKIWIKNNLKKYKNLNLINDKTTHEKVIKVFEAIKIKKLVDLDLHKYLKKCESQVAPLFFEIKVVTDNTHIQLIKDILLSQLVPKLDKVITLQKNKNLKKESYIEGITKYLNAAVENHSYVNTIVFGNNRQKLSDLYVPLTLISKKNFDEFKIPVDNSDLLNRNKKILISSTAGMGKSTLAKKIFLDIINYKIGIPIFIELRRLTDKNSIVGELVKKFKPLHSNLVAQSIFTMIEQGGFIFIFDGFDEIEDKFKPKVIQKINYFISKTIGNNFIITSRPETALNSFGDFQEFWIKDLEVKEAFEVLRKYGKNVEYSQELISKINGDAFESIQEFLKNPMLVSLLYKAYEYKRRIPYKKHLFYSQVFDALYENHDLTKEGFTREKKSKLDINNFEAVLRYIAYKTAIVRKTEYTKTELIDFITKTHSFLGIKFSSSDFIKDLTTSVPLFTVEGNYYNWSHKSLQDYFAARFIQIDSSDKQNKILWKIYNSINCDRFNNILDILYDIDYKTFRNTIIYWLSKDYFDFNAKQYTKYNNVDSSIVDMRKALLFKRIIVVKTGAVEFDYKSPELENFIEEGIYSKSDEDVSVIFGLEINLVSYIHFQYYFINFLLKKRHRIVIKNSHKTMKEFHLQISSHDAPVLEISDSKKLWINKDKYHFEKITQYINSKLDSKINHNACLEERVSIDRDIKIKEEDDLLQFE